MGIEKDKRNDTNALAHGKSRARIVLVFLVAAVALLAVILTVRHMISIQSNNVKIPIILYHHITSDGEGDNSIAKDVFLQHLDAIKAAGYETVTFQQMIDFVEKGTPLPAKPLVINFDDGYSSNYEIAWPALQERGMKGTIFVIGSSVGRDMYKDTGVSITPHFSYEEAQEMIDSGTISIQLHTYDMHQWAPLEADGGREGVLQRDGESPSDYRQALTDDMAKGIEQLQAHTTQTARVLAYPLGLNTPESEEISAQLGIQVTLTTKQVTSILKQKDIKSLRLLGRYSIDDCTPEELLARITS